MSDIAESKPVMTGHAARLFSCSGIKAMRQLGGAQRVAAVVAKMRCAAHCWVPTQEAPPYAGLAHPTTEQLEIKASTASILPLH